MDQSNWSQKTSDGRETASTVYQSQIRFLNDTFRDLHRNDACVIIGGGPSVNALKPAVLSKTKIIATNVAIYSSQFSDLRSNFAAGVMLDEELLSEHIDWIAKTATFPVFTGNTVNDSCVMIEYLKSQGIYRIPSNYTAGIGDNFDSFSNGGNSGFFAIQLALILGFKTIGLLGFDGKPPPTLPVNFHSEYGSVQTEHAVLSSRIRMLDSYCSVFKCLGLDIVNLSPSSELRAYRKVRLAEWPQYVSDRSQRVTPTPEEVIREDFAGKFALPYRVYQDPSTPQRYRSLSRSFGGAIDCTQRNPYRPVHRDLLPFIDSSFRRSIDYLKGLRGVHKGERIAVLGSGPSLEMFSGEPKIAIAVNGASEIEQAYRYFICGDPESPRREWFYASRNSSAVRIVSSFIAPFDEALYPDEGVRTQLRQEGGFESGCRENYHYIPSVRPAAPHAFFLYDPISVFDYRVLPISRDQDRFLYGGTIAGVAVQLAFVMGASEIHLFGCSLDNESGRNYCRLLSSTQTGRTIPSQVVGLSKIISAIESEGVPVIVHGRSRLKSSRAMRGARSYKPPKRTNENNVICVKWGKKFSADYVNNLYRMVGRHLSQPYRFVCLTDDKDGIVEGVETIDLPVKDLEFCWSKLNVFSENLLDLNGVALFLDLDVIVVDSLEPFFEYAGDEAFVGAREWYPSSGLPLEFLGAIFRFRVGELGFVLDDFVRYRSEGRLRQQNKWDEYLGGMHKITFTDSKTGRFFRGDQVWISERVGRIGARRVFPAEWCPSYKFHCGSGIPDGARVILFHGYPKPHELSDTGLLHYWKGGFLESSSGGSRSSSRSCSLTCDTKSAEVSGEANSLLKNRQKGR